MTYICKHFEAHELVPKHIYDSPKPVSKYTLFDDRLLKLIDRIKDLLIEEGFGVAMILNSDTSTLWYEVIEKHAAVIMPIIGGRIHFIGANDKPVKQNNKPQFMCYFAPFGRATKQAVYEPVHTSQIYTGRTT